MIKKINIAFIALHVNLIFLNNTKNNNIQVRIIIYNYYFYSSCRFQVIYKIMLHEKLCYWEKKKVTSSFRELGL